MTAKKTTTDKAGTEAHDLMASMQKMQQSGLGPLSWFGTAWLESATEVNRELADFLARRIKEDVRTQHEILNCSDPAQLQEIQSRFFQRAVEDYSAETGTLTELGKEFMDRLAQEQKKNS